MAATVLTTLTATPSASAISLRIMAESLKYVDQSYPSVFYFPLPPGPFIATQSFLFWPVRRGGETARNCQGFSAPPLLPIAADCYHLGKGQWLSVIPPPT